LEKGSRILKARGRAGQEGKEVANSLLGAARQDLASKDLADFSNEYAGLKLSINVEGLGEVEGRLLKASRYWFKLLTSNGVLYVNKAHVILIKPLELASPRIPLQGGKPGLSGRPSPTP
jgi:hypothetical protein